MIRPTIGQIAFSMWEHRPSLPELLGWALFALVGCWVTGWPLILFGVAVGLLLVGGTLQMAFADLRKDATPEPAQGEEGVPDAED